MQLSPEDIAAAEACGVSFLPATDAQVQRLAMQRKIFYRAGQPILATRGGGFFETVGTLQQLIEEGRQQQRDLTQWLQAAPMAGAETEAPQSTAAEPVAPPEAKEEAPGLPVQPGPAAESQEDAAMAAPEAEQEPPKRPRQRRRRPEPAEPQAGLAVGEDVEEAQELEPVVATPLPSSQPRSPARAAPQAAGETAGQERGKRWLVAGAARRGRAGKHWSTRQR